jgi:hypothetical protein
MDDLQIANLVLGVAAATFAAGFLAGYAVRVAISHNRYVRAQRRRIDSWQRSGSAELTDQADDLTISTAR